MDQGSTQNFLLPLKAEAAGIFRFGVQVGFVKSRKKSSILQEKMVMATLNRDVLKSLYSICAVSETTDFKCGMHLRSVKVYHKKRFEEKSRHYCRLEEPKQGYSLLFTVASDSKIDVQRGSVVQSFCDS